MTAATDPFAAARQVADTVLYEGYVLYPYRASSSKNQTRWQFGVLMPPSYVAADASERSGCQTELLFEAKPGAVLHVQLRFLHVARRTGGGMPDWDETVERELDFRVSVPELSSGPHEHLFAFDGDTTLVDGAQRIAEAIGGAVVVGVTPLPGPYAGAGRLTVRVENRTPTVPDAPAAADRDAALATALVAAHTILAVDRGRFLSMTDPPEWASVAVKECVNAGTWPVLASPDDRVVLSSPIILGDHPEIAPESPGDLYDATEIDEILTLRTMVLTDAEKAEARATDPRAAALIDRVDDLPQEHLDRLHGALRYLRKVTTPGTTQDEPETILTPRHGVPLAGSVTPGGDPAAIMTPSTPWWDPGADASVSPEHDGIIIDGVRVARGSRVRLRPGARRTDAQDLFLRGRTATVEAVFFDVDGQQHLGVTPDDDAELAEIARWHGRYLYFAPDEVEPVDHLEQRP